MGIDKKDPLNNQRKYGPLLSLGVQLASGTIIFVLLGYFIDQKLGGGGITFTVVGMVFGFGYCMYEAWKLIRKFNDK